ncbi:hypothetical protein KAU19_04800 [Candidatus Parcubacteria bacterium]|nr:hypothetical protein [Candidatus Parcubacteria bacterium]
MAKNFRKRRDAAWKKEAKKKASLLSSSDTKREEHYTDRCIERAGIFMPVRRKFIEKKIKSGHFGLKKLTRGKFLITNYRTGETQVVSKNLKVGITFINTS